jgi:diguanylate cyclase (GGDEF)-like protein
MQYFTIALYLFALIVQIATVFQCFAALKHIGIVRSGWMTLAVAFTLVLIHGLFALMRVRELAFEHALDALFFVITSSVFFVGIFSVRRTMELQIKKNTELELLNQYDILTHALSRAETLKRLEMEIERSERFEHPLSLFEIDIDHFKRINDEYGHQVGDEILRSLTQNCLSVLRTNDSFGRIGGEEFLIILPETSPESSLEAAERLRMRIESARYITSASCEISLTISVGVVNFDPQDNVQ